MNQIRRRPTVGSACTHCTQHHLSALGHTCSHPTRDRRPTRELLAKRLESCQYFKSDPRANILTRVVVHVFKHICDSSLALSIHAASKFADETDLLVVTQPLGGRYKTLRTNGGGNTKRRGARAIGVEIPVNCQYSAGNVDVRGVLLVHLVDQFVLRVSERSHQVTVDMSALSLSLVRACIPLW